MAEPPRPPDATGVERTLSAVLEPVLSARRSAAPLAAAIATLEAPARDFVLRWTAIVAQTSAELAFQFASAAPQALTRLSLAGADRWVSAVMDAYDREGLNGAAQALRDMHHHAEAGVALADVSRVLELFMQGLAGRRLRIASAETPYTDTETVYLPAHMARAPTAEANFLLYKATAALLWAQTRYGTYNANLESICSAYPDPQRALAVLNALETIRLDARLESELPGLASDLVGLLPSAPADRRCVSLLADSATVEDSLAVLREVYRAPPALLNRYASVLVPAEAARIREARIAREKGALRQALSTLQAEDNGDESIAFAIGEPGRETPGEANFVLTREGDSLEPPAAIAQLIESIVQDLGTVPDDYLIPGGAAPPWDTGAEANAAEDGSDDRHSWPVHRYDEWDYVRGRYRRDWCALREVDVVPGDPAFVERVYALHGPDITRLKRTFECLRAEKRLLRRQPDGDDIDLDALVEGRADMRAGAELSPLVFTRRQIDERDLAVMIMVDMSGSTKGWINDAEREALVMLCEALNALGDRYAIYGFSGLTRLRCVAFRVKRFEEPYGPAVRARISGMEPQDYTRMGPAIRHLTGLLDRVVARTKLLITLSDGKPEDYSDHYRGRYGIEDTRQALLEAQRLGIKPFCITIDREARDYLPHMYGPANWVVVDDVSRLAARVAEIYRHLAS